MTVTWARACDLDYEVSPAIEIAWQTTDTEVSSA